MLAAAPELNSALGLVQVVLTSIAEEQNVAISDNLKQHVLDVLHAASDVVSNPESIAPTTPSEALELALRMRGSKDLCDQVAKIHTFNEIREDIAEKLLASMRSYAS
jgi:hypothetical protein